MSVEGRESVVAVGWATVELDRAAVAFAPLLEPGSTFQSAPDCRLLGARCRVGRTVTAVPGAGMGGAAGVARTVILLEPATEGRLAAFLARNGEGWCATWTSDDDDPTRGAGDVQATTPGPLGPERLASGTPATGPFRLAVRPGTIRT